MAVPGIMATRLQSLVLLISGDGVDSEGLVVAVELLDSLMQVVDLVSEDSRRVALSVAIGLHLDHHLLQVFAALLLASQLKE